VSQANTQFVPAQLILKTGEIFLGQAPSQQTDLHFGEVVFNTGMVGYVESLTDPSYAGQILAFTYPLIGNYGVSEAASWESKKIHAKGVVMSELAAFHSSHSAQHSLIHWLQQQDVPFITGIDTRALTKKLRNEGVVPGAITPANSHPKKFIDFDHINWVKEVSIKEPIYYGAGKKTIIAIDCGMKENILRCLQQLPIKIKRVPYNYDFTQEDFDGVFISNGPGDPQLCTETVAIVKKALAIKKPVFGICLGTQLMALAVGAKTYKLRFGHRSQNQPCLDTASDKCFLTSQNHGYAIDEASLPKDWRVSFRNLNDNTVAGIEHKTLPFFSVQFHPEAAPGPVDTQWLFEKFWKMITHP
jgi:carbamoyl-phosphate synthase small subunit